MNYTGFIYLWYDNHRKLFCLGSHMGTIEDGYVTSTGMMKQAYNKRPENFKRRIIHFHDGDNKTLYAKEQYYLDMIKEEELFYGSKRKYYNIKPTASGISGKYASELRNKFYASNAGKEWLKELSRRFTENNPSKKGRTVWNTGLQCNSIKIGLANSEKQKNKYTEKLKEKRSIDLKNNWKKGIFDNRPKQSTETIEQARLSRIGFKQTDKQKNAVRTALSKSFIVTYPDGKEEQITNLNQFCKDNKLDQGNMSRVAAGEAKQHKKFKIRHSLNIS